MLVTIDSVRALLAGRTPQRASLPPGAGEAAVALALAPGDDGQLEALFIKRASRAGDPWSGQMALPGGRRESGDRDLLHTVRRETHEETGIDLPESALLGDLDDLGPVSPNLPPLVVRPFVFALPARPQITLNEEVALHLWIPLSALVDARTRETVHVGGQEMSMPGYRIGPHFIWGMTERIIVSFLDLLPR